MSSTYSSPGDEFGSGEIIQGFRNILDIATDQGDYYLLKSGPFTRIQKFKNIFMNKPMIIPAGRTVTHMSEGGNWLYTNFTNPAPPMFSTFGLKEGTITGFTDNTTTTTVASLAHNLNEGDTVTVIGSRVADYDGNFEISNVLTDSFDIPVSFVSADGQCRFTQLKLRISAMADGGDGTVDLTMVNHGLDPDISINISNASNGLTETTYVIEEIVDADTITITATFPGSTGTADGDMAMGIIDFTNETMFNFTFNPTPPQCFNLQGDGTSSILLYDSSNVADFDVGEIRDFLIVGFANAAGIRNCSGLLLVGGRILSFNNSGIANTNAPFSTESYKSCFVISEGSSISLGSNIPNIIMQPNQSFFDISPFVTDDFRSTLSFDVFGGSGDIYSKGKFARTSAAISDGGGSTIIIPVDDTKIYREGDTIELSESTSYDGLSGTIQTSGIIQDTSIQVDILFSTADTDVLTLNTTLASKDQTSPGVSAFQNQQLRNSTLTANAFLPFDANLTVSISAAATPVPIGGTWSSSELERVTVDSAGGIATITGKGERKASIAFGGTVSGSAASVFAFQIFQNGIDITDTPPVVDIINASSIVSTGALQIVTINEGDEYQVFVSNPLGTQDPTVHASHLTISEIT